MAFKCLDYLMDMKQALKYFPQVRSVWGRTNITPATPLIFALDFPCPFPNLLNRLGLISLRTLTEIVLHMRPSTGPLDNIPTHLFREVTRAAGPALLRFLFKTALFHLDVFQIFLGGALKCSGLSIYSNYKASYSHFEMTLLFWTTCFWTTSRRAVLFFEKRQCVFVLMFWFIGGCWFMRVHRIGLVWPKNNLWRYWLWPSNQHNKVEGGCRWEFLLLINLISCFVSTSELHKKWRNIFFWTNFFDFGRFW